MFSSWRYGPLQSTKREGQGSESDWEAGFRRPPKEIYLRSPTPWIISTIFFGMLAAYFSTRSHIPSTTLEPGAFATDLEAVQPWIEYESRVFTGKLTYDPVKQIPYRDIDRTQPQYFGKPGPEIDTAWEDLLRNEFTPMTPAEAASFTPAFRPLPTDGEYRFELDVLHSLHCLNSVRKKLYEYIYQTPREEEGVLSTDPTDWEHIHMDHCLDQIRQSIQCHGDVSPVPLFWWEGYSTALGQGQTHTCRKWDPIREWVDRRNLGLDETRS